MRSISVFLLLSFSVSSGGAQGIAGPILGFAYDAAHRAIRPVRGIPGAAILGDAVDPGFPVALAVVSPRQDFALAVSAADGLVRIVRLGSGAPSVESLDNAMPWPSQIIFSPSGNTALLFDAASGRMQSVTAAGQVSELAAQNPAAGLFAISDDGAVVLMGGASLISIGPNLNAVPLPYSGPVAALAFRPGSHDFVSVTPAGDVYLTANLDTAPTLLQLYTGDSQTAAPVAAQFSADGARAFTVNAAGTVASFDLSSGAMATLSCQCSPTGLGRLRSATVLRLNEISTAPLMLFDASPAAPRMWFVPADAAAQGSAQ